MRYNHFSMLPERAFQPRGRYGMTLEGGGGGGPTQSTVTQTNIPDWLRPQTEALLGAATQEYFKTTPTTYTDPTTGETKTSYDITGVKPYTPYSVRPQDYLAGFSPIQQQVQFEAANMQRPGGFQGGTQLAGMAGQGAMDSAQQAYGYGRAGYGSGMLGQQMGIAGGQQYGGMGAGYGAQAAGLAPEAQAYGRTGADIGLMGLRAESLGRDVGQEARQYARQAAGMGGLYSQMATDPYAVAAYMSPYQAAVTDMQKQAAIRDYDIQMQSLKSQAARSGAFGGARQAIQAAEAQRNLNTQLQGIENMGRQAAYDKAIQSMQYGVSTGLQGLQGAQAGLGTALSGGQLGLSGIGQAMAGQQAGLAGLGQAGQLYGLGMQGAGVGLSGIDRMLAGTGQGMQGAQVGLQGVSGAQAGYSLANQAAANIANIASQQQAADLARMQFQAQQGATQQAQEQKAIDQAVQNYAMAQQYPAQQLAGYSGLLRGYATPTTTTSQYQAAPSPVSQLSGLGLTGAAMYGLAKKEGGKIEVDGEGIDDLLIRKTLKRVAA